MSLQQFSCFTSIYFVSPCMITCPLSREFFFFPWLDIRSGRWPSRRWGFEITLTHATFGRTPLDEWSARRRHLNVTTHTTLTKDSHAPGGVRTYNPSKRGAADPRLRLSGNWNRHPENHMSVIPTLCFRSYIKTLFSALQNFEINFTEWSKCVGKVRADRQICITAGINFELATSGRSLISTPWDYHTVQLFI